MTNKHHFVLVLLLVVYLAAHPASAQVTGTSPFGSYAGGPDVINLSNNNVHWTFPVLNKPGRGMPFQYNITYDSSIWFPSGTVWSFDQNWGIKFLGNTSGQVSNKLTTTVCTINGRNYHGVFIYSNWYYRDRFGVSHSFPNARTYSYTSPCGSGSTSDDQTAADGSGYQLFATGGSGYVVTSSGTTEASPLATDRNGNQISVNGTTGAFTDTLGTTVLTVSGTAPNPVTFTYTAPSGANAVYTLKYATYSIQTNFGCSITDYGTNGTTTANLVSEIDLPDVAVNPSDKYTFTYEATPGHTGYVTGRIASITLPTGGTISYAYSGGSSGHINCADGSTPTLTRTTPDGTWTYAHTLGSGAASTMTITDPSAQANQTVIQFQGLYETERQVYSGSTSGTLLRQWFTCYNGAASPCNSTGIALPITRRTILDQYGTNGLQCKHDYFYSSVGGLQEQDEYDYGSGAPGGLLRKLVVSYASLGNITTFRKTVSICNGTGTSSSCTGVSGSSTGTVVAQTIYCYDEATPSGSTTCGATGSPTATSGTPQHVSVTGSRGNATTTNTLISGSTFLATKATYFDTGNVQTATDVNGAQNTFVYPDATSTCGNSSPTSINEPLSMSRSFAWNCTGGVMTSITDENGQVTSTTYNDPYFWRPASTSFSDGGQTSWAYNSSTSLTTTTKMNSSQNIVSTVLLDGLGRTSQTQLNDPEGPSTDYSVLTYDPLGRPYRAYNPTRCNPPTTNCGEATWGYTTTAYDALSRPTSVTLQDGSVVNASYSNNTVTATDPAGKARRSTLDALGRLTQVLEDPTGLNYETDYGYDALGNLLCVGQKGTNTGTFSGCGSIPSGWHARTFVYDAMSRLTSETNPETGTIAYKFDSDSNCASPNSSSGDLISRTDARNIRTCYQYDTLHRLTQKSYSDGITPTAGFGYDESSIWGATLLNPKGRLTHTAIASTAYSARSYDAVGRTLNEWQWTPYNWNTNVSGSWPVAYTYDFAGDTTSYNDGAGITLTQSFDTAGRLTGLTSSLVDANHPGTLASGLSYMPASAYTQLTLGNGYLETRAYNPRLQPTEIKATNGSGFVRYDFTYGYGLSGSNNGNLMTWNSTGWDFAFNRAYTYDALNRMATLNQSSGNPTNCSSTFSLSWNYDAWGNRTDQNLTGGTCNAFHALVNSQNQLSGSPYQYDAAGNMTYDGNHTYFYDAENRMIQVDGTLGTCSTATACYTYDAFGRRVRKAGTGVSLTTDYAYDLSGNVISEFAPTCSGGTVECLTVGYLYLGGSPVAEYKNSTTYFVQSDHLGSARIITDPGGNGIQSWDYLPYGELLQGVFSIDHLFIGDERDSETNLDHTWFRQYSSQLGRWMHPDPSGRLAVSLSNPQTWNRYAYVSNNPLKFVDRTGLVQCVPSLVGPAPTCVGGGADSGGGGDDFACSEDGIAVGCGMLSTNGYTIFDAIHGAPGTYFGFDIYGNLFFGFSEQLWSATWNQIDAARSGLTQARNLVASQGADQEVIDALAKASVPDYGWTVRVENDGLFSLSSGVIPDLYAAKDYQHWLFVATQNATVNINQYAPYFEVLANMVEQFKNEYLQLLGIGDVTIDLPGWIH